MADNDIKIVMEIMYGQVLDKFDNQPEIDPRGMLLLLLASVIHHSDWLQNIVTGDSGHPFSLIPLLNHPDLLVRLKAKVSDYIVG